MLDSAGRQWITLPRLRVPRTFQIAVRFSVLPNFTSTDDLICSRDRQEAAIMTDKMAGQLIEALKGIGKTMEQMMLIVSKMESRDTNRDFPLRGPKK